MTEISSVACLVACSSSKLDSRQPAWKLYDSVTYEKSMAAAMVIGHPYVMSAKHGLLTLNDRVDPYDETLKGKTEAEKNTWAAGVLRSLPERYTDVILFGGRDYVEPIKRVHNGDFTTRTDEATLYDPFENTVGNGEQSSVAEDMLWRAVDGLPLNEVLP